jgi:hypothetical protein
MKWAQWGTGIATLWMASGCLLAVPSSGATDERIDMERLQKEPAFTAVRQFADVMLKHGRDEYGATRSPLFAGQLNVGTLRIPAGTPEDPGLLGDNPEVAGCKPSCQNLLFDLGLLDVLKALSTATSDPQYETARREYLTYFFKHCRHPQSGYFPWGEHVGYDLVKDTISRGAYKGMHEVKGLRIPWDQFWDIDPAATRHEIDVSFFNHLCDVNTFAFNRHANMDGKSNQGGGACSLACSGGLYLQSWCWLYRKTGEKKFLNWARKINRLWWDKRSTATNLFPSSEDRPEEMWYADALTYACLLVGAAEILGAEGNDFREQAITYLKSYHRYAYDPTGPGFFDTLNIATGKSVVGPSKHFRAITRPKYLGAWSRPENSSTLFHVAIATAMAYEGTGDEELRVAFDRVYPLLDVPAQIRNHTSMVSGDAAGVLASLVHMARRSGDREYLERAKMLTDHLLATHFKNGLFTSGLSGKPEYYSARMGSSDLAAALLGYALSMIERPDLIPPIRNPWGAMPW